MLAIEQHQKSFVTAAKKLLTLIIAMIYMASYVNPCKIAVYGNPPRRAAGFT